MSATDPDTDDTYSIGRAASVSGISCATLRMWERRYGRPVPVRLPSGHRRYTADQMRWPKGLAQEEGAQQGPVQRQGIVEHHGTAGSEAADTGIPSQEANHGRGNADI